jgi:putative Mn2+ efflux pump MntP
LSIAQWLSPEVISFIGVIFVFIVLKKASAPITYQSPEGDSVEASLPQQQSVELENELSPEKWQLLLGVGKVVSLIALCATGALQPSVLSFVYYAVFLGAATWWGCNKELERCENHS